jgi:membrane-bound metal-dependent hydrolase YbcI (DUF457 family)
MILPGHVAAPLLASRIVGIDRRVAVIAGVAPDLVDKFVFYVLRASHWTRVPAHSMLALISSTIVVALAGRVRRRDWRWGVAWLVGYGLHFLCDMAPGEGVLPWLWPLNPYAEQVSSPRPWFLSGGPVPWITVITEVALVLALVAVEVARHRAAPAQARQ